MYGVKEIMNITGYGESKSYRIIDMIQEKMKKEDNNVIIIGKRVPKQYFDRFVLGIKENIKESDKNE